MFEAAQDEIKKYLETNPNSPLLELIATQLDAKYHISKDVLNVLPALKESIERLEAPGKNREEVIAETLAQLNLLTEACKNGTEKLRETLQASDKERRTILNNQLTALDEREKIVADAEAEMRKGFPTIKKEALANILETEESIRTLTNTLTAQISALTEARDAYTRELSKDAMSRLSGIAVEIEDEAKKLRQKKLDEIQAELDTLRTTAKAKLKAAQAAQDDAEREQETAEDERDMATRSRKKYERKLAELEAEIEQRVQQGICDKKAEMEALRTQIDSYRLKEEEYRKAQETLNRIAATASNDVSELEKNPETLVHLLRQEREKIGRLEKELLQRPTEQDFNEYKDYKAKYEELSAQVDELCERERAVQNERQELTRLKAKEQDIEKLSEGHQQTMEAMQREVECLKNMLNRYQTDADTIKKTQKECEAQLEAPENCPVQPMLQNEEAQKEFVERLEGDDAEIRWLNHIDKLCEKNGFRINQRILYAFHTCLKNNEWSPLTVLAGVSGTGKSELPRLYCTYGGLNYHMVSVLPNWDSPEAMLGYYNSLDNHFEAQPLTHFLARCANHGNDKNGFRDQVNLVLLDEMNLAHVELYFADFLSLLERRRGIVKNELPSLKLTLASGIPPYEIPVSRNILWAGTMNQDETTKALSDKVLDRSACIYFPRPTELYDRETLKPIKDISFRLPYTVWEKWIAREIPAELKEDLNRYRRILQEINKALGSIGRAIGHRVWQSIAYYMVQYPTVRYKLLQKEPKLKAELDKAFEDQLVLKIMPKLRGIETRGYSKTACLNPIRDIIAEAAPNLLDDYDNAMKFGQGQFLWLSADYLMKEEKEEEKKD